MFEHTLAQWYIYTTQYEIWWVLMTTCFIYNLLIESFAFEWYLNNNLICHFPENWWPCSWKQDNQNNQLSILKHFSISDVSTEDSISFHLYQGRHEIRNKIKPWQYMHYAPYWITTKKQLFTFMQMSVHVVDMLFG